MPNITQLIAKADLMIGKNRGIGLGAALLFCLYLTPLLFLFWLGPAALPAVLVPLAHGLLSK